VVKNVKNFILPEAIAVLNMITLPQINFTDGYVYDIKFSLDPIDPSSVVTEFDGNNNAIIMNTNAVGGTFTGSFYWGFLLAWIDGDFKVKIKNGGAKLELDMPLISQPNHDNTKQIPAIDISSMYLHIDSDMVDIELSGSLVADMADLFLGVF
jgi:hypothetical protein